MHYSGSPTPQERIRSPRIAWPAQTQLTSRDAINLVCFLNCLRNLRHPEFILPAADRFPFSRLPHPALLENIAPKLLLDSLARRSHTVACNLVDSHHIQPASLLALLAYLPCLENLKSLQTNLEVFLRLPSHLIARLTSLSLMTKQRQQDEACAAIERLCTRSLRRLKITNSLIADARKLAYLEVRDQSMLGTFVPVLIDVLSGTSEGFAAVNECPALRTVVWAPVRAGNTESQGEADCALPAYQRDLVDTLESGMTVFLRVNAVDAMIFGRDGDRKAFTGLALVEVDDGRWRDDAF